MVRCFSLLAILLVVAHAAVAEPAAPVVTDVVIPDGPFGLTGSLDERYLALRDAEAPRDNWYPVADQLVAVGALRVSLASGAVTPVETSGGVTSGFMFQGACTVTYRPPGAGELDNFRRKTGLEGWEDAPCDTVLMHTDDGELLERLAMSGAGAAQPPQLTEEQEILLRSFIRDSSVPLHALARHIGASRSPTPVYDIMIYGGEFGTPPLVGDDEARKPLNAISAAHIPSGFRHESEGFVMFGMRRFGGGRYGVDLASHPIDSAPPLVPPPPSIRVLSTELTLDLEIAPTDRFTRMKASAKLTLTPTEAPKGAVLLSLSGGVPHKPVEPGARAPLVVTRVLDYKQRPLPFLHRSGQLLVSLAGEVAPGQAEELTIDYAGSGVEKEGMDHFGLFANWSWFPAGPNRDRMKWKATICLPDGPRIAGSGKLMEESVVDGTRCEVHETDSPINFPALNMGYWVAGERVADGRTLRGWFDRDYELQVQPSLDLSASILSFYENMLGPIPHKEIDIAQGRKNRGFWQAPDGLIEISASWDYAKMFATKRSPRDYIEDWSSYILSHELAHQWWGHVVTYESYRHQWISESFADYCAYLYMHGMNGEAGHLEWWRSSSVFAGRRGVMTLGSRNGGLYQPLVYARGPLILHMFRRMVGDEAFFAWMGAIVDVGRTRPLSTEDLIVIAEHIAGPDSRWFWEQWLHHPGVPDLAATWSDNASSIELVLTQSEVAQPLRLQVPVLLKSKKDRRFDVLHQVMTDSETLTVSLPTPRGGLKAVVLDPQHEMTRDKATAKRAN